MCIHIYMCICVYVYMCICVHMYMYMHMYMYVYVCVYIYIYMYACTHVRNNFHTKSNATGVCETTLLSREPLSCNPSAETALQF